MSLKIFLITFSPFFILIWMFLFWFGFISYRLFLLPLLLLYPFLIADSYQNWHNKHQKFSLLTLFINVLILIGGVILLFSADVYSSPFCNPWQCLIYLQAILSEVQQLILNKPTGKQKYSKILFLILLCICFLLQLWTP